MMCQKFQEETLKAFKTLLISFKWVIFNLFFFMQRIGWLNWFECKTKYKVLLHYRLPPPHSHDFKAIQQAQFLYKLRYC